jgi:hypothetical protein
MLLYHAGSEVNALQLQTPSGRKFLFFLQIYTRFNYCYYYRPVDSASVKNVRELPEFLTGWSTTCSCFGDLSLKFHYAVGISYLRILWFSSFYPRLCQNHNVYKSGHNRFLLYPSQFSVKQLFSQSWLCIKL